MNRKLRIYIAFLVLFFAAIIALDASQPKPVDWTPTYSIKDKIPLGLYILDQEIAGLLKQEVLRVNITPYEYLDEQFDYDTLVNNYRIKGTILDISENENLDNESVEEIFYFVSHGNAAFLSMKQLPKKLLDSLHLKVSERSFTSDTIVNRMANRTLGTQKYSFREGAATGYFSKIDTLNTTILGYQENDSLRANFIKIPYKNGNFFLHLQPAAFTNYYLLKDQKAYAEKVLSYVPKDTVYWYTKDINGENISASPLRYMFSQPALKWAWYIFIFGMIVFIIFNAKRKQRIVPIIKPLENTTVDFTKTIGNLYYQEGDHDTIIDKKIIYFLEKIRNDYLIDTTRLDEVFITKLHQKSGRDIELIERAIFLINRHRNTPHNSIEEDLININNAIEKIIY